MTRSTATTRRQRGEVRSGSRRAVRLTTVVVMAVLAATACRLTSENRLPEVWIYGREEGRELEALVAAFEELDGPVRVRVTGDSRFEATMNGIHELDAHERPAIAIFPQPGKVRDLVRDHPDVVKALPDAVRDAVGDGCPSGAARDDPETACRNFLDGLVSAARADDGTLLAVPVKTELKSVIWYSPQLFQLEGHQVPTTLAEFEALVERMRTRFREAPENERHHPLCLGLQAGGSEATSGWPFTDWVEDYLLRRRPDLYEPWIRHQIPFDDAEVVQAAEQVRDLWFRPDAVLGGVGDADERDYAVAGREVVTGGCLLYHQGNFYASTFSPAEYTNKLISAFILPGPTADDAPLLTAGSFAVMLHDDDATRQVMAFLASPRIAEARARQGGYLSPRRDTPVSLYPTKLEQRFAGALRRAKVVEFDASDAMTGPVGIGTFWQAGLQIADGRPVAEAFREVEATWPG